MGQGKITSGAERFRILFVCLGNICRSPSAEAVMLDLIQKEGLEHQVECDSCGTTGFHSGEKPDSRMRAAARQRGITLAGQARKLRPEDLDDFDLILTMDQENFRNVRALASDDSQLSRIRQFCDFCRDSNVREVPDPYYGGSRGFEVVLDILADGCSNLIEQIQSGKLG